MKSAIGIWGNENNLFIGSIFVGPHTIFPADLESVAEDLRLEFNGHGEKPCRVLLIEGTVLSDFNVE